MSRPRNRPNVPAALARRTAFVDSGVWLAFFSARDGAHLRADAMLRSAANAQVPLITSNLVLAEVHRLVVYRVGVAAAAAVLRHVDESRLVTVQHADAAHHRAAREWLERFADQRFTYTDAVSFAVMEARKCQLAMTFDRHFLIAGFAAWSEADS